MRPVVLCIMDGWGERADREHNAVALAGTPVFDRLRREWPHTLINASGAEVGLPDGQMGNSEVGHMNLGAGRVVLQDLPRINRAVAAGELADLPAMKRFLARMRQAGGRCHLLGLLSAGGVHAHMDHAVALARECASQGIPVHVHAILDGRDVPPKQAQRDLGRFEAALPAGAALATVVGRFFAMDRDRRWDRVETAWRLFVRGEGTPFADAPAAVAEAHGRGETDEFVTPAVIAGYDGMRDGDGLLVANFRADRMREILAALLDPAFTAFARPACPEFAAAAGMASYSEDLDPLIDTLFPPAGLADTLGEVVARAGRRQLRIAETEKYPHVTFFLNGGQEKELVGEQRILVPSPRVRTYDLQPEMSAHEVTDRLVDAVLSAEFDLIVANFANPDMVGHTGDLDAAIAAVETVDGCVGRVDAALRTAGGVMFLTADHGNCETMFDPETGGPHTAHTTNPVPAILVGAPANVEALDTGRLADVAPTLLELLGIGIPRTMNGHSLLRWSGADTAVPGAVG